MIVRIMILLFAVAAIPGTAFAQQEENVERLVRAYFTAFQKQDWDTLVDMMHPESLKEVADAILVKLPQNPADIPDAKRAEIEELLTTLAVETPEAARKLLPRQVYLRILRKSGILKTVDVMKDVKTEIKNVSITRGAGQYYADVDVVSEFRGKIFSGTTHFVVAAVDGTLKVVAMTKTKQPPKNTP